LVEIPPSATIIPFAGTSMRIMPKITGCHQKILHLEAKLNRKPVVFIIHPNEIIDESNEPRMISRRSDNFIAYVLSDLLRAKLKTRNLGENALPIYEKLIIYYTKKEYKFTTMQEYVYLNKGRISNL